MRARRGRRRNARPAAAARASRTLADGGAARPVPGWAEHAVGEPVVFLVASGPIGEVDAGARVPGDLAAAAEADFAVLVCVPVGRAGAPDAPAERGAGEATASTDAGRTILELEIA